MKTMTLTDFQAIYSIYSGHGDPTPSYCVVNLWAKDRDDARNVFGKLSNGVNSKISDIGIKLLEINYMPEKTEILSL